MGKQRLRGPTLTMGVNQDDEGRVFWFIARLENGEIRDIEFSRDHFDSVTKARISGFAEIDRRQHSSRRSSALAPVMQAAAG